METPAGADAGPGSGRSAAGAGHGANHRHRQKQRRSADRVCQRDGTGDEDLGGDRSGRPLHVAGGATRVVQGGRGADRLRFRDGDGHCDRRPGDAAGLQPGGKGAGTGGVQTEFRAGMSYVAQSAYGLPTLMNNDQYVKALQDAAAYAGVSTNPQNLLNNVAYAAYQAGQHTDWQKLIAQTGYQKNVQMGMSGISGNTRFNLSGNYFDQTGTAVGLEFSRGTGTASIDHTQGRLRLGVTGNFTHSLQTVNGGDGLWGAARQQTGFGLPYDSAGALILNPDGDPLAYNPLKLVQGRVSQNRRDRLFASAFAQFDLFPGVNLRVNFGPDYTSASAGNFTGADVQFGGASYRSASYSESNNFQYILDNMLQINRDIGTQHHIDATLLYGIQKSRVVFDSSWARDIPYDEALYYAIGQGDQYLAYSALTESALESFMGRAELDV